MMFRRSEEGALKCALRDLRLDDARPGQDISNASVKLVRATHYLRFWPW